MCCPVLFVSMYLCVYYWERSILVYVDDMVMAGKDEASLQKVKDELGTKFKIKDLGKLKYFLGMTIVQNQEEQSTWMGQPDYTTKLLEKHGMSECKPVATPVDPGTHLTTLNEKRGCESTAVPVGCWKSHVPVSVHVYET